MLILKDISHTCHFVNIAIQAKNNTEPLYISGSENPDALHNFNNLFDPFSTHLNVKYKK